MVLASRDDIEPETIISHCAPQVLIPKNKKIIYANSNSHAAIECANGFADGCITTLPCAEKYNFKIIQDFGEIPMVFAIHKTK